MFVGQRREGDGREPPALQPVDCCGVDGNSLLWGNIGTILQVIVLPLLLGFEIQPCETAKVLLAYCFVHLQ